MQFQLLKPFCRKYSQFAKKECPHCCGTRCYLLPATVLHSKPRDFVDVLCWSWFSSYQNSSYICHGFRFVFSIITDNIGIISTVFDLVCQSNIIKCFNIFTIYFS